MNTCVTCGKRIKRDSDLDTCEKCWQKEQAALAKSPRSLPREVYCGESTSPAGWKPPVLDYGVQRYSTLDINVLSRSDLERVRMALVAEVESGESSHARDLQCVDYVDAIDDRLAQMGVQS
jgi:hypothetical protein